MNILDGELWWIGAFLIVVLLGLVIMVVRNKAAKTDSVNHTKEDTVRNSVSIKPKKNTTKLD
jgi:hypothetical protein